MDGSAEMHRWLTLADKRDQPDDRSVQAGEEQRQVRSVELPAWVLDDKQRCSEGPEPFWVKGCDCCEAQAAGWLYSLAQAPVLRRMAYPSPAEPVLPGDKR